MITPAPAVMYGPRNHLFSGPGFALDKYGSLDFCDFIDECNHLRECRRSPQKGKVFSAPAKYNHPLRALRSPIVGFIRVAGIEIFLIHKFPFSLGATIRLGTSELRFFLLQRFF